MGANTPHPDEGLSAVYGADSLLRAAAVLRLEAGGVQTIRLPVDIPRLVAAAYDEHATAPDGWNTAWQEAVADATTKHSHRVANAKAFLLAAPDPRGTSLRGWIEGGHADADAEGAHGHSARATVRDGAGSIEVVVLEVADVPETAVIPAGHPTHAGSLVPLATAPDDWRLRRAVLTSTIQLGEHLLGGPSGTDAFISALEQEMPQGWQSTPDLRGQLLLLLDENGEATAGGRKFAYSRERGMTVSRA